MMMISRSSGPLTCVQWAKNLNSISQQNGWCICSTVNYYYSLLYRPPPAPPPLGRAISTVAAQ